jgi:hypothetical protein
MPKSDLERLKRVSAEMGPNELAALEHALVSLASDQDVNAISGFSATGEWAAQKSISPEDLLIAVRQTARQKFPGDSRQAERFEVKWPSVVRALTSGYFGSPR